jgi:hypothetical protein
MNYISNEFHHFYIMFMSFSALLLYLLYEMEHPVITKLIKLPETLKGMILPEIEKMVDTVQGIDRNGTLINDLALSNPGTPIDEYYQIDKVLRDLMYHNLPLYNALINPK